MSQSRVDTVLTSYECAEDREGGDGAAPSGRVGEAQVAPVQPPGSENLKPRQVVMPLW